MNKQEYVVLKHFNLSKEIMLTNPTEEMRNAGIDKYGDVQNSLHNIISRLADDRFIEEKFKPMTGMRLNALPESIGYALKNAGQIEIESYERDFLSELSPIQRPTIKNKNIVAQIIQKVLLWIISNTIKFILAVIAIIVAGYIIIKYKIPH